MSSSRLWLLIFDKIYPQGSLSYQWLQFEGSSLSNDQRWVTLLTRFDILERWFRNYENYVEFSGIKLPTRLSLSTFVHETGKGPRSTKKSSLEKAAVWRRLKPKPYVDIQENSRYHWNWITHQNHNATSNQTDNISLTWRSRKETN